MPIPRDGVPWSPGEVSAWVDANVDGFPILKCSAGFTLLSGPCPLGIKLMDMCKDQDAFNRWFSIRVNVLLVLAMGGEMQFDELSAIFQLHLHHPSPYLKKKQKVFASRADCYVDVESTLHADGEEIFGEGDRWPVLLVFQSLAHHEKRDRHHMTKIDGTPTAKAPDNS